MKLSCVATRHQLSNTGKLYSDNLFPAAFFYCCKSRLPNKELSDERNIQSSSYHNIYGRYYATIFLGFADKYPRFLTAGCIKGCTILILSYDDTMHTYDDAWARLNFLNIYCFEIFASTRRGGRFM